MKYAVVVLACVLAAVSAQFPQYGSRASAFSSFGNYQRQPQPIRKYQPAFQPQTVKVETPVPRPIPVAAVPVARYSNDERNANILKSGNDISEDGSYTYYYETNNGIAAQAQGTPRNFGGNPPVVPDVVQGSFSWTSPEGVPIAITYVADENGYQPQGAAIPTPPPIPPQIARALEYIARSAPRK